ncbi:MAG: flavodoxin family protein [Eubacterium sp.]|nr:flavodoxin family protein [Eubacterium sp.]
MKTIIVNGSPRKNWNTAQLMSEAKKGAESVASEVTYIDLYDLNFTGCRSCMACKRKGIDNPCKCFWKDDLSAVIEDIYSADHLIIGSPIYHGEPTGLVRCLLERVTFPPLSYDDYSSLFKGKVNVDIVLTMNAPENIYKQYYEENMKAYFEPFHFLNGTITITPVYDTLQVKDYTKYDMGSFSEEHKKAVHDTTFVHDLERAFQIGKS